jgi:hypothetical protein
MPATSESVFFEERHEVAQQILQHKAACTGTGIQRGKDKQRFKQNTEVVPEAHIRHRHDFVEHVSDTTARVGAPPARFSTDGSPISFAVCRICSGEIHKAQELTVAAADGHIFQLRGNQRGVFTAHFVQVRHGDAQPAGGVFIAK